MSHPAPPRRKRSPIRTLILVLCALLLAALLLSPGLLGWTVHRQASAWLAESWPEATVRWQRGWFASRVEAADGDAHVALDIRHSPFQRPGPLLAEGPLTLAEPATRIDLEVALDWGFDLSVDGRTDAVTDRSNVDVAAGPSRFRLVRARDGAVDLQVDSESVAIMRPGAGRLDLESTAITLATDGLDPGRLRLAIESRRRGAPANSRLAVRAEGIDRERAAAWGEALAEAASAPPGTTRASLAWVGAASAWEQLARAGLELYLEPLDLDGRARIEGEWRPGETVLQLQGGGDLQAVEHWLIPIYALSTGEPEADLRTEFVLQLEALAEQSGLEIDGGRFRVDWPTQPE